MYKFIIVLIASVFYTGCQTEKTNNKPSNDVVAVDSEIVTIEENFPDTAVAVQFINDYINNCNKGKLQIGVKEWVMQNPIVTQTFKNELSRIVDEAYSEDPEMGLGFDPIFAAQDYDESGMELESVGKETGYLLVRGKEFKDYRLTMRLKQEKGKWLVEGCGVINMPQD